MRMSPQSMRMVERLDRQGVQQTERERLDNRAGALTALVDTCTIQTRTLTADAFGSQVETWADTYPLTPCRLMTAFGLGAERLFASRLTQQADYLLLTAHGQALTVEDRITSVAGPDGVTKDAGPFEILAVGKLASDRASTQALLRRIT